jgi:glycosyltransferase involved in cell wall biosynthesis
MNFNAAKTIFFKSIFVSSTVGILRSKIEKNENVENCNTATKRKLFIDISVIVNSDAHTGIQRYVRAVLSNLLLNDTHEFDVCPVVATRHSGYAYATNDQIMALNTTGAIISRQASHIVPAKGDVFLALDLATRIIPKNFYRILKWKADGMRFYTVVYDLIPVLNPEYFNFGSVLNFNKWLRSIAVLSDGIICISNAVKKQIEVWNENKYQISPKSLPVYVVSPGWDIKSSLPSRGMPESSLSILDHVTRSQTVLMVGTIEPRKCYDIALLAMEELWKVKPNTVLLIVGKPGWKTNEIQSKILGHKLYGKNLFWLSEASDELLTASYNNSSGLLFTSSAEGFGLPVVEALSYGLPVLSRKLPSLAGIESRRLSMYPYNISSPDALAKEIIDWLDRLDQIKDMPHKPEVFPSWDKSLQNLIEIVSRQ